MIFEQYYLQCLSHASYLIGDETTGRAVVIDPQRDVAQYIEDAEARGLRIDKVFETHFHADFLSGHLELAEATGADIVFGEAAAGRTEYPIIAAADGTVFSLGEVTLEVRATPGHTPESVSIVVRERPDAEPTAVLTGDTLFIGDVGRPDLLGGFGVTAETLGRQLYHSLHEVLLTLPDDTKVYPAHGAGSACGKNLSTETVSTIGEQRRTNYALQPMSEDAFVEVVTEGQPAAPLYFPFAAVRNREARPLLDDHAVDVRSMTLDEVLAAQAGGAVVLDTRDDAAFAVGHLAGSVNVGLGGRFAEYAGEVIAPGTPIVLVADDNTERAPEAVVRLARIGFDSVVGTLDDPVKAFTEHPEHARQASRLSVPDLVERKEALADLQVVDVRNIGEARLGMIPGAKLVPLAQLTTRIGELDPARPTVVHCAGGYRSSIAASVLRSAGFPDVSDLLGGYNAWAASDQPVSSAAQEAAAGAQS